jgi:hypothetical protein
MHPYFGGSLVVAWIQGGHFNPRSIVGNLGDNQPGVIARFQQSQDDASPAAVRAD